MAMTMRTTAVTLAGALHLVARMRKSGHAYAGRGMKAASGGGRTAMATTG